MVIVRHKKHPKKTGNKKRSSIEYIIYFFAFVTPLFELPQLVDIYTKKSAEDVSLLTWGFFLLDNFVWIAYGLRKREWPVVITSIAYEIIEIAIVVGIIIYR